MLLELRRHHAVDKEGKCEGARVKFKWSARPQNVAYLRGPTRASSRFEKMNGMYSETVPTRVTFPISARGDENSRSICRNLSSRHISVEDITWGT